MELRSPCGAGVGQMGYNFDGKVYTCDEGRMIGRMGDPIFEIGDVNDAAQTHRDFIAHPSVRAVDIVEVDPSTDVAHVTVDAAALTLLNVAAGYATRR